jgi:ubiquinol-cytochrome c reductase cytochrome c subunit
MQTRFILFAAAAVLSATAFGAAPSFGGAAPQGDAAKGKAAFERVGCWSCHGLQGQGGREGPRIAAPVPMAYAAMAGFVRTTSGDMPPYTEKVLSNQEMADIYAFLQSIPAPPDHKTIPLLSNMQ